MAEMPVIPVAPMLQQSTTVLVLCFVLALKGQIIAWIRVDFSSADV